MEMLDGFIRQFRRDSVDSYVSAETMEIVEQMAKLCHATIWAFDVDFEKESIDEIEKEIEALEKLS